MITSGGVVGRAGPCAPPIRAVPSWGDGCTARGSRTPPLTGRARPRRGGSGRRRTASLCALATRLGGVSPRGTLAGVERPGSQLPASSPVQPRADSSTASATSSRLSKSPPRAPRATSRASKRALPRRRTAASGSHSSRRRRPNSDARARRLSELGRVPPASDTCTDASRRGPVRALFASAFADLAAFFACASASLSLGSEG